MVSRTILAGLLAAASTGAAVAAEPDWRAAGGSIFPAAEARPASADTSGSVARLPPSSQPLDAAVEDAASRHRIDPKLLHALVTVESAYHANAVSPAGAAGLTQLMPGTARAMGVEDPFEASANLAAGAEYLARQLLRFGDLRLALAAYNSGPQRVAQLGRVPEIPETQTYVSDVISCYLALTAGRSVRTSRDCRRSGP
jgi:soluble lytic murein transglycosylase-like protein